LEQQADSEPTYLKAREIVDDIGETPKAVAQHLQRLQNDLTGITLEQWGRSKSVTWIVQEVPE
jgi:predicted transcriptional regulator